MAIILDTMVIEDTKNPIMKEEINRTGLKKRLKSNAYLLI